MDKLLEKQGWHLLALVLLLDGVWLLFQWEGAAAGQLWGFSTAFWFWLAIAVPVAHQVFVGLAWRSQLYTRWITRRFGENDLTVFGIVFFILFFGRIATMVLVAISNANSLELNPILRVTIGSILLVPSLYLAYSVVVHFGVDRALGADHFDDSYQRLPMVREGIFKYTKNGMYVFGFFLLWAVAIFAGSKAALIAAGFNHLYIWVHYFTVEKPDMAYIYNRNPGS